MILNPFIYQSGGGGSGPILLITVTGATPSSVVATKSGASVSLAYDSTAGKWWAVLPSTGTWTVTAYRADEYSKSVTVNAANVTVYETSIRLTDLPDGYTELSYIELSGGQYINTNLSFPNGFRIQEEIEVADNNNNVLFGSTKSYWNDCGIYTGTSDVANSKRLYILGATAAKHTISNTFLPNTRYSVDICNRGNMADAFAIINENNFALENYTTGNFGYGSIILYLFSGNRTSDTGTPTIFLKGKAYGRIKIYDSTDTSNLKRDYCPARNSSNVIGYYDFVSSTFFTNAGTGSFIAGPEV